MSDITKISRCETNGSTRDLLYSILLKLAGIVTGNGGTQILTSAHVTSSGSVSAGKDSVTFMPSSDYTGLIDGVSYPGASWQVIPFTASVGRKLPAIAYTVTTGSLNIVSLS